jgi:hypothetical protein
MTPECAIRAINQRSRIAHRKPKKMEVSGLDKRAYSARKMRFPQQTRSKKSPTRLLVLLIVLLVLLYLVGLFSRSLSSGGTGELETYAENANKIVEQSNQVAKGFNGLMTDVKDVSRKDLKSRLSDYSKESKKTFEECKKIEPPEELTQAHVYLTFSMELRADGLKTYSPALFNALKDQDLEVASGQVAGSLKELALSDRAYQKFATEVKRVLKSKGIKQSFAASEFLPNDTAYEKASVLSYLEELKGSKGLEEIHGINVVELSTKPKQIKYVSSKKLAVLPSADAITATVVIENQGNQLEVNVPVVATLKSVTDPEEQKKRIYIPSLSPGKKKEVTFSGLKPTQETDVANLLTITAGPVPKEKFTGNNASEFKFVME